MKNKKNRSQAQSKANAKYKKNIHRVNVEFYRHSTDTDLFDWLVLQGNKQGYIKSLIKQDMELRQKG